jgi:hypothetical protein
MQHCPACANPRAIIKYRKEHGLAKLLMCRMSGFVLPELAVYCR